MSKWRSHGSLVALGVLGLFPRQCWFPPPDAGGSGGTGVTAGTGGIGASAGSGGTGAAAGAASGEGGGTCEDAGAAGAPNPPDRVSEPLLGCGSDTSGRLTPGTFQLLPPAPVDPPSADASAWITDWSGDGRVAVGYYTTPAFDGSQGA